MTSQMTLEHLEQQVMQLSVHEQLKLLAYISEHLSIMPLVTPMTDEQALRRQQHKGADDILALCDAAAEMWEGTFDAAEEIGQIRQSRDTQIWPSKS
jgi:hypothetical protein